MLSSVLKHLVLIFLLSGPPFGCLMATEDGIDEDVGVTEQEISYNGHDYLFVTTPKTWYEAQSYCSNYTGTAGGYHLATINDAAEESFLNTLEMNRGKSRWWIGYTDQWIEGSWVWSNDYSTYANWAPGEPDNVGDQDCAVDRFDGYDAWDDQPCWWTNVFVCERDSEATGNRGSFSYSLSSTNSATATNTKQYTVYLSAGQLFTMGTCGVPGASGSNDTYLRLKNPSGAEIANNDDSGGSCGLLSNVSIVAPTTGTYVIYAGCYANSSCSGTVAFNY